MVFIAEKPRGRFFWKTRGRFFCPAIKGNPRQKNRPLITNDTQSDETISKTYVYSLAPQYITPRGPETQTNTATDGSMSVYGYVTISYNRQAYTQTIDKFLLTEVEGGWEIEDHSERQGDGSSVLTKHPSSTIISVGGMPHAEKCQEAKQKWHFPRDAERDRKSVV